jgi:hypothetical protein
MMNIFRKKNDKHIENWEYQLLEAIVDKLPLKYAFLKNQVNSDFILDSLPNELLEQGWKRILCNQNLYKTYRNANINYKLVGINVFELGSQSYKSIELDLYEGIIIGYKIEYVSVKYDITKIDLRLLREKYYDNKDRDELKKLIGHITENVLSKLDIEDTFKIEIPEGEFYVIKNLGDGNYLSINTSGSIFGMIHDPYQIEKLFDKKETFFEALKTGTFDILEYYNKKMS